MKNPAKTLLSFMLDLTGQELVKANSLEDILQIVRQTAREIIGADGATIVLRDGEFCYYADEDAIGPLWKGQHFPLSACISGWAMINSQTIIIEDIYKDDRIPHNAYKPTFVKSLVMVPVKKVKPIAAIGNYWAYHHVPTVEQIKLLESLAELTANAMERINKGNKKQFSPLSVF
jgi:GAF domain-containing protein